MDLCFSKKTSLIFLFLFNSLFCSMIYLENTNQTFHVKTYKHINSPKFDDITTFLLPSLLNSTGVDVCDAKYEEPNGLSFENNTIFVINQGICNLENVIFILSKKK